MSMSAKQLIAEAKEQIKTVAPADAAQGLILDVREPAELKTDGKIAGAIHIPRGVLEMKADEATESAEEKLTAARNSGETVYVTCASGGRAALAAATLQRMGYNASVIKGGLEGWKKAGLPVTGQD